MADVHCLWCGAPSTRLCDTVLATVMVDGVPKVGSPIGSGPTCEAPLCNRCTESGMVIVCHRNRSRNESLDRCPYCVEMLRGLAERVGGRLLVEEHRAAVREHGRRRFRPRLL